MAVLLYRARPLIVMVPPVFINAAVVAIAIASGIVLGAALAARSRAVPACDRRCGGADAGRPAVRALACRPRSGAEHGGAGPPTSHGSEPVGDVQGLRAQPDFYTHVRQDDLESEAEVVEFLRSNRARALRDWRRRARADSAEGGGHDARTLGEVLYFNASAVKLRTLIAPDRERDLERVLLVTNR